MSRPRVYDIIPTDVRIQDKYLNLHAKRHAETGIQNALEDVKHVEEQELAELSKQATVKYLPTDAEISATT